MSLSEETKAFISIRNGEFEKALELIDSIIREDENNFWAWYLGSVAFGMLGKKPSMQHYLDNAENLQPESVYVIYLKAYLALLDGDIEKSLWEWTKITDMKDGWLARELLEKARKNQISTDKPESLKIYEYIVLPDFFNEVEKSIIKESSSIDPAQKPHREKKHNKRIAIPKWVNFSTVKKKLINRYTVSLFTLAVSGWFFFYYHHQIAKILQSEKKNNLKAEHLQLDEYAHIYLNQKAIVKYTNRNDLMEDFQNAKKLLQKRKVNQARYLIQKIIHSNADFKTIEKAKIFIKFIPRPHYRDFDDNIPLNYIIKEPELYYGALMLYDGEVVKFSEEEDGAQFQLLIESKESSDSYLVHAFYSDKKKSTSWTKENFMKNWKGKKIVFYGRFKGIVSDQKIPYIEIYRLWT